MARVAVKKKRSVDKNIHAKFLGKAEPELPAGPSVSDVVKALNWYRNQYDDAKSKSFTIDYLSASGYDKSKLAALKRVDEKLFGNIGWCFRLLANGSTLPAHDHSYLYKRVDQLIKDFEEAEAERAAFALATPSESRNRFDRKAEHVIADLEDKIDSYLKLGEIFRPGEFMKEKNVSKPVAEKLVEFYNPLYEELADAANSADPQLVEAYSHLSAKKLKSYSTFILCILQSLDDVVETAKATRKLRVTKAKPVGERVKSVQYKPEDPEYKIKSVEPVSIVGASQVWLFNTKYRVLTVIHSEDKNGLDVKGTTIQGLNEASTISKKLRKPEEVLPKVLQEGKVGLRGLMDSIKCKSNPGTGRINNDTVILRVVK